MQDFPLISVCITTYNHEKFLPQALDGILMQRGDFHLEVLLGEDGSTDNTPAIVRDYARRYPEIIRAFYHDPADKIFINGRQTGRKNFIHNLTHAQGDYVAVMDGDDCWLDPHKLQKQLMVLQQNTQLVACCHAALHIDENGKQLGTFVGHHDVRGGYRDFRLSDVIRRNPVPAVSILFRNPRWQSAPPLLYKTDMGDWPLHILNALRGDIRYVDEKMAAYRVHSGGIWASFRASMEKTLLAELRVWQLLLAETALAESVLAEHMPTIRQLITQQYAQLAKLNLREHNYRQAWHYWREQGACNFALAWRIGRKQARHLLWPKRGKA